MKIIDFDGFGDGMGDEIVEFLMISHENHRFRWTWRWDDGRYLSLHVFRFKKIPKIIQTKIPPNRDTKLFEEELLKSFEKLQVKKIDLLAIHGINSHEHLHQAIRDGGCIDILRKYKKENLIGYIGFSTHGESSLIEKTISTNFFDYVNLHWYFIRQ